MQVSFPSTDVIGGGSSGILAISVCEDLLSPEMLCLQVTFLQCPNGSQLSDLAAQLLPPPCPHTKRLAPSAHLIGSRPQTHTHAHNVRLAPNAQNSSCPPTLAHSVRLAYSTQTTGCLPPLAAQLGKFALFSCLPLSLCMDHRHSD